MNHSLFKKLHRDGLISDASLGKIESFIKNPLLSVHDELRIGIALGVILLTTGLGILIYENINEIGHGAIVAVITALSIGGFIYCYRHKPLFSREKVASPGVLYDYILLFACLCVVILIGYLQYEYSLFGNRWGLATFIPTVILLWTAYYFDHLGVLSMGITSLAAWCGIVITPAHLLVQHDFNSNTLIMTGIGLGITCLLAAKLSVVRNWKKHFELLYLQFGIHFIGISCLAGLFSEDRLYPAWLAVLALCSVYLYIIAIASKSFQLLLFQTIYCYIAFSHLMIWSVFDGRSGGINAFYLICLYFIFSAALLILFFIRMNRKFKQHDRL